MEVSTRDTFFTFVFILYLNCRHMVLKTSKKGFFVCFFGYFFCIIYQPKSWLRSVGEPFPDSLVPFLERLPVFFFCNKKTKAFGGLFRWRYDAPSTPSPNLNRKWACHTKMAILEFKMAAIPFVRHFKLLHYWTQHVNIPLCTKFQRHRSFRTQDRDFKHFVLAAILEFKMAAGPLVRSLGSANFWNQRPKIPLYAKFHTFCRKWTSFSHITPTTSATTNDFPIFKRKLEMSISRILFLTAILFFGWF